jgi:hypothetical protein
VKEGEKKSVSASKTAREKVGWVEEFMIGSALKIS